MTTKPKQKAGPATLADKLKKKKKVSPLEALIFSACMWKPENKNNPTHISNIEIAHLRTSAIMKRITVKLLLKQAVYNLTFKRVRL